MLRNRYECRPAWRLYESSVAPAVCMVDRSRRWSAGAGPAEDSSVTSTRTGGLFVRARVGDRRVWYSRIGAVRLAVFLAGQHLVDRFKRRRHPRDVSKCARSPSLAKILLAYESAILSSCGDNVY